MNDNERRMLDLTIAVLTRVIDIMLISPNSDNQTMRELVDYRIQLDRLVEREYRRRTRDDDEVAQ